LPEVYRYKSQIDELSLKSAAYFLYSGQAAVFEDRVSTGKLLLLDASGEDILDGSVRIIERKLGLVLERPKVEKIKSILIESNSRFTNRIESMILSDARNLDDIGTAGLFKEFRRQVLEGKGLGDVLNNWQRKLDYRYWETRLNESFRFAQVRELAQLRFNTVEQFMDQLRIENNSEDIEERIGGIGRESQQAEDERLTGVRAEKDY
jgi:hypothetical protein